MDPAVGASFGDVRAVSNVNDKRYKKSVLEF